MAWTEHVTTYEQALGNLTEENWHRERAAIEAEVKRVRDALDAIQWGEMGACASCGGFSGRRPHDADCIVGQALATGLE